MIEQIYRKKEHWRHKNSSEKECNDFPRTQTIAVIQYISVNVFNS